MQDRLIEQVAQALRAIPGLSALVLGGSRARGTAGPNSDYDFGLYYESAAPLHIANLRAAILPLVDNPLDVTITGIGEWGPWINGGAWLKIGGHKVDFLYRDLARVREVIAECAAGRFTMNYQVGHPHGFCSAIWMGEVATCKPIDDKQGVLAALKARTTPFPPALRQALVKRFNWEVAFAIENAQTALGRRDQAHIAGCAYRALCCTAQVLFALNGRYLINEKGALAESAAFPSTLDQLDATAAALWSAIGTKDLAGAIVLLRRIAADLETVIDGGA